MTRPEVWVVVGLAFEAKIARTHPDVRVQVGVGRAILDPVFEAALPRAAAVISFGTAGGLDPALPPGAMVLATHIVDDADGSIATDAAWLTRLRQALPQARAGVLFSTPSPVIRASDKAAVFARSGALAADMESALVARLARRHGVPFAACRVVIDRATQTLPRAALVGMQPDGSTRIGPSLRALLRDPGQLPALCRLGRDAGKARHAMAQVAATLTNRFAFDDDAAREKETG